MGGIYQKKLKPTPAEVNLVSLAIVLDFETVQIF